MVAYNFMPQFEPLLISGAKSQTIRAMGKRRHAEPGDMVQGYVGQRTKHCRKVFEQECIDQKSVFMVSDPDFDFTLMLDGVCLNDRELERLAIADGFSNTSEFVQYFAPRATIANPFNGVLIKWTPPISKDVFYESPMGIIPLCEYPKYVPGYTA